MFAFPNILQAFCVYISVTKIKGIMNQRLREVVNKLKNQRKVYSDADFARIVDIPRGDLSQMMSGKRKVSKRCVSNLLREFPEINEEWFTTGKGEMLNNTSTSSDHSVSIAGEEVKENNISINADQTIALLVSELAAQRRLTEKVVEQNSELIAVIAGRGRDGVEI